MSDETEMTLWDDEPEKPSKKELKEDTSERSDRRENKTKVSNSNGGYELVKRDEGDAKGMDGTIIIETFIKGCKTMPTIPAVRKKGGTGLTPSQKFIQSSLERYEELELSQLEDALKSVKDALIKTRLNIWKISVLVLGSGRTLDGLSDTGEFTHDGYTMFASTKYKEKKI